jgi:protein-disulfide isomerase
VLRSARHRRVACAVAVTACVALLAGCAGSDRVRRPASPAGAVSNARDAAAVDARFAGIPQGGTALGLPSAPLTLVEFGDLQCPFCRHFALRTLPTLLARYVRPGKLRLQFLNVPLLGPDSARAARVAMAAAAQDRLWQFLDLFYVNQRAENTGYVTDGFLRTIATGVRGLDADQALRTRAAAAVSTQLSQNLALARQVGIPGTPTFLLGRTGATMRRLELPSLEPGPFVAVLDRMLRMR